MGYVVKGGSNGENVKYTFNAETNDNGGVDIGITDGNTKSSVNIKGGTGVTVGKTDDSVSIKSNGTIPTVICNTAANDPNKVITIPDFDPAVSQEFYIQFTNGIFDEDALDAIFDREDMDDIEKLDTAYTFVCSSISNLTINDADGSSILPHLPVEFGYPIIDEILNTPYLGGEILDSIKEVITSIYFFSCAGCIKTFVVFDPVTTASSFALTIDLDAGPSLQWTAGSKYSCYSPHGVPLDCAAYYPRIEDNNLAFISINTETGELDDCYLPLPGKAYTLSAPASKTNGNATVQITDGETVQSIKMIGKNGIEVYSDTNENELKVRGTSTLVIADAPSGNNILYTGAITAQSVGGWDNSTSPQIVRVQFPSVLAATQNGTLTLSIDGSTAYPLNYFAGLPLGTYMYTLLYSMGVPYSTTPYGVDGYALGGSGTFMDFVFDGESFTISNMSDIGLGTYGSVAFMDVKNQFLTSYIHGLIAENGNLTVTKGDGTTSSVTLSVPDGSITTAKIANSAIANSKIADGAITNGKISDGTIQGVKLIDGCVTTAKIADSAITEEKIANYEVTNDKLAGNSVTTSKIADFAVHTSKINGAAVTTEKIADGAITTAKLADDIEIADIGNLSDLATTDKSSIVAAINELYNLIQG